MASCCWSFCAAAKAKAKANLMDNDTSITWQFNADVWGYEETGVMAEWNGGKSAWVDFDENHSRMVERAYQNGAKYCHFWVGAFRQQ